MRKEYMEKLMNGVKEGPADCIRVDAVAASLKKDEKT